MSTAPKLKSKSRFKRLKRLFSLRRKDATDGDPSSNAAPGANATLPWAPEDIMDAMHGMDIPSDMKGEIILMEIGGVDRGWFIDCTESTIKIGRYDIPDFGKGGSGRAPGGPRISSSETNEKLTKSLPWIWYKDRKVFSKIESGKLSDMAAFVTGRIAASGEMSKFDALDKPWKDAKEIAEERKKALKLNGGSDDVDVEDDDEEEEDVDQEAKIIATFKPDVEPTDPRTIEFWKRHFGTDMLVASYLYLLSSIFFAGIAFYNYYITMKKLDKDTTPHITYVSMQAHSFVNIIVAVVFALASIYFIKLSYPETMMLMAYRVMTKDPSEMTFVERYFTSNEMLIATWLMNAAFVVPFVLLALVELVAWREWGICLRDMAIVVLTLPLVGLLSVSAMPDNMRANGGKGSSHFFDYFWVPLLGLKDDAERQSFWMKHLGNDGIAGMWIMAVLGVLGGVAVIPPVIIAPFSIMAWLSFWSTIPFTVGSLLMVRATYPEYMNSSIFFSNDDEDESSPSTSANSSDGDDLDPERAPLLT